MHRLNDKKKKSITAKEPDVTTRSSRCEFIRHTTTNYSVPYTALYNYVIIVEFEVPSIKYHDCIFALIILHARCILTSKFRPVESNSC